MIMNIIINKKNIEYFFIRIIICYSIFSCKKIKQPSENKNLSDIKKKSSNKNLPDIKKQEVFFKSLLKGDNKIVKKYIKTLGNLNFKLKKEIVSKNEYLKTKSFTEEETPLIIAVRENNYEIVKTIIDEHINNKKDIGLNSLGKDYNAIMYACQDKEKINILKLLLSCPDIKLNVKSKLYGVTPLMISVDNGNLDTIKLLLQISKEKNKDIAINTKSKSHKNYEGLNVLQKAILCRLSEDITFYYQANFEKKNRKFKKFEYIGFGEPYHQSFFSNELGKGTPKDPKKLTKYFSKTSINLRLKLIRILVKYGAEINHDNNYSPIHLAIGLGCFELVKELIETYPEELLKIKRYKRSEFKIRINDVYTKDTEIEENGESRNFWSNSGGLFMDLFYSIPKKKDYTPLELAIAMKSNLKAFVEKPYKDYIENHTSITRLFFYKSICQNLDKIINYLENVNS